MCDEIFYSNIAFWTPELQQTIKVLWIRAFNPIEEGSSRRSRADVVNYKQAFGDGWENAWGVLHGTSRPGGMVVGAG